MKSLNEFKNLVEEEKSEKSDYSKFDALVRAGLANKAQLQRIHRILDKMQEEKPQFNNADKMIMQNIFNKMADLVANNPRIFQQARKAVHEEVEQVEESLNLPEDPPMVLLLKRVSIRYYPGNTKVALYHNAKLNKVFTVPYANSEAGGIQAEETIEEAAQVMDQLHNIVKNKGSQRVKFGNGKSVRVDHYTASAVTQLHGALKPDHQKKLADMVHKSPQHLAKAADFAFSKSK